jgi:hypothetical protein
MILDAFGANGLKGAEANVKRDLDGFNTALTDAVEDFRSEVQSRGRRRDRTAFLRVDRLIAVAIGGGIIAIDVRRKRNMPEFADYCEKIIHWREADTALTEFTPRNNLGHQLFVVTEKEAFAYSNLSSGANEAFPFIGILFLLTSEEDFDSSAKEFTRCGIVGANTLRGKAAAASIQASGKHLCVVEDQEIGGTQKLGEFTKLPVFNGSRGSRKMEKAGCSTIRKRVLRNQLRGKVVLKIGDEHDTQITRKRVGFARFAKAK